MYEYIVSLDKSSIAVTYLMIINIFEENSLAFKLLKYMFMYEFGIDVNAFKISMKLVNYP